MRALAALAVVCALALPVSAEHCTEPSTSTPEGEANGFYWDNDACQPECKFSIWIYQETNDIPGLQRGDEVVDDTCHGMVESDTIIF